MGLLSRAEILAALEALAHDLEVESEPVELLVVGGAALVVLYDARMATKDVDAVVIRARRPAAVREAAQRVAEDLDLPSDWLNDGAKGYLQGVAPGATLFEKGRLTVRAAATPQLLAMKLSAWRDDVDIEDARLLLRELAGDREAVWEAVLPFLVPGRELKARYAFEDLWESERED